MSRLRTLALSLLLAPAATPAAGQAPASWVSAKTDGYDLYASNPALLAASRAQLDSARTAFARRFPGPTPKIVVVVGANRDELLQFDVKALRTQAGDVLAWTVATPRPGPGGAIMEMRDERESPSRAGLALLGNLPAAVVPATDAKGGAVVRFMHPRGVGEGIDLRAEDVIRGVNGTALASQQAILAAYDKVPTGANISFEIERAGKTMTVSFAKPAGEQRAQIQQNPSPATPGGGEPRILSHEAGHHLFGAWVRARMGGVEKERAAVRARHGGAEGDLRVAYGSPLLPDWLDEAGATLSESEGMQAERRKYILDNFGRAIPLATLFAAEHPAMPGLRQMAEAQRQAGTLGQQSGPISVRVQRSLDAMDPGMFYAQSLSVSEFLAEREGPSFLAAVVDAALAGKSMTDALQSARTLPKTVDALEREWRAWVAR